MFKKTLLILMVSITVFILPYKASAAFTLYDYATYYGNTGEEITVAWDPYPNDPTHITYEVRVKHVEHNIYIPITMASIPENQITFSIPKAGHYIIEARTVNAEPDKDPAYSIWVSSIDSGRVADVDRSWWVYGKIAGPGPIIIGNVFNELYALLVIWV